MMRWRTRLWRGARLLLWCVAVFLTADLLFPFRAVYPLSRVVTARDGTVLYAARAADGQWRMPLDAADISPSLRRAVLFKEDRWFYYHPGINVLAVARAMTGNVVAGRRLSGASTITMQVARMLRPGPRTYRRKLAEMFRALQLEAHYSKDQILHMYLNLVPYGSNIQGVKAASVLYFGKMPDHLSPAEIATLVVIPNRPNSLVPGRHNAAIMAARKKWLNRLGGAGVFTATDVRDALAEPITARRRAAPFTAQQLVYKLSAGVPDGQPIHTSIDATIQHNTGQILAGYMQGLHLHQIHNAAIIVIDNATRQVLAYHGSSHFYDTAHAGQVDGVIAMRSPGSTLKPLLYGLCMDAGLITPKSVIADVPVNIRGYSPENYDREFRGNVTIEYALSHSLNIPAVRMLEASGLNNFLNVLTRAGFTSVAGSRKELGMSVILGGCSVRLSELAALYCAMANGGVYRPLVYSPDVVSAALRTDSVILSPASAWLVTSMLTQLQRPDVPNAWQSAKGIPHIAWKTGTSYGRRDAWSIGYNSKYTVGVWVGNFSGQGVPDLSGTATATPLLFQLFNALPANNDPNWLKQPAGVGFRLVCAESGKVPAPTCTTQVMDYFLPGTSAGDACTHQRQVWLSANERMSYCSLCLPPDGYKTRLLPNYAPELITWYEASAIPYTHIPPHNPACSHTPGGSAPTITSLTNGITYIAEKNRKDQFQLSCATAPDVHVVHWYINDQFFATAPPGKRLFFTATTPTVKISCADDKGRNTDIRIQVQYM